MRSSIESQKRITVPLVRLIVTTKRRSKENNKKCLVHDAGKLILCSLYCCEEIAIIYLLLPRCIRSL